jgi:hypothetical protein
MAALVIPLANLLPSGPGSWKGVFMVAAGLDLVAACLALLMWWTAPAPGIDVP